MLKKRYSLIEAACVLEGFSPVQVPELISKDNAAFQRKYPMVSECLTEAVDFYEFLCKAGKLGTYRQPTVSGNPILAPEELRLLAGNSLRAIPSLFNENEQAILNTHPNPEDGWLAAAAAFINTTGEKHKNPIEAWHLRPFKRYIEGLKTDTIYKTIAPIELEEGIANRWYEANFPDNEPVVPEIATDLKEGFETREILLREQEQFTSPTPAAERPHTQHDDLLQADLAELALLLKGEHDYQAPELRICIEAWLATFRKDQSMEKGLKRGVRLEVSDWVRRNHPTVTAETAIGERGRIPKVCNWKK